MSIKADPGGAYVTFHVPLTLLRYKWQNCYHIKAIWQPVTLCRNVTLAEKAGIPLPPVEVRKLANACFLEVLCPMCVDALRQGEVRYFDDDRDEEIWLPINDWKTVKGQK